MFMIFCNYVLNDSQNIRLRFQTRSIRQVSSYQDSVVRVSSKVTRLSARITPSSETV
jgi:hypothetical protein